MNTPNPYRPPNAPSSASPEGDIETVAAGQKLVIYAILVYFLAVFVRMALGPLGLVVALGALGLALAGVVRLCTGMGDSTVTKVLCVVLMFVPLVGLVVLLVLNSRAISRLRAAGYRVGFLGASR
jgi:hypothetical protein